jgi:preprotein translocase subunit SecG
MDIAITALILICSILLILVILIQNPKGGGISSSFGSATQLGGVKKTTDTIEKLTWGLAIAIAALSIVMAYVTASAVV